MDNIDIDVDNDSSGGGFDGGGGREGSLSIKALNIKALWGGGGARMGDLLYHLLRGRKDHMTRVKVLHGSTLLLDVKILDVF